MQVLRSARRFMGSLGRFAAGELVARVCAFVLYAFTTRWFGVAVFGIVALAQTVSIYVALAADLGYKLVGARIIARDPRLIPFVVRLIVPRRCLFAVGAGAVACIYALAGPMPPASRLTVTAFSLAVIPASLSLDWVLWGSGSYWVLSGWKALVAVLFTGIALCGMILFSRPLAAISTASVVSAIAGSLAAWLILRSTLSKPAEEVDPAALSEARSQLRTSSVATLGTANLLNLVFTNSDMLLLAAMTNAAELGNYGSATRLLFAVFSAYYLVLNALYPTIARSTDVHRIKRYLILSLGVLCVVGGISAWLLAHFADRALMLVYGPGVHSGYLLRILAGALPFELCVSLIGTVLASQGLERLMLRALLAASAVNIAINLIFIPRFKAVAAAWSTVIAYGVLLACYLACVLALKPRESVREAIVEA